MDLPSSGLSRSFADPVAKSKQASRKPIKDGHVFVKNRRAAHEYHIRERLEAGVALWGSEVKSIRDGRCSLVEAFCQFHNGELFLLQAHIAEYTQAHMRNHVPLRRRKLLMHKRQLERLEDAIHQKGMTVIPLALYAKGGLIKLEIGLCQGKQLHDKRATIKEREQKREVDRAIREARK